MQDKENLNSWVEILRDINKKVDQNSYETWFEPTLYIGQEKDVLYIKVPNSYFRDWLSFHYSSLITESSEALFGKTYEIKYIFDETPGPFMRRSPEERRSQHGPLMSPNLNPHYTFENFVVGLAISSLTPPPWPWPRAPPSRTIRCTSTAAPAWEKPT